MLEMAGTTHLDLFCSICEYICAICFVCFLSNRFHFFLFFSYIYHVASILFLFLSSFTYICFLYNIIAGISFIKYFYVFLITFLFSFTYSSIFFDIFEENKTLCVKLATLPTSAQAFIAWKILLKNFETNDV